MVPDTSVRLLDTLDDRREIHTLLGRLSPRERVAFLGWCCERAKGKCRPKPSRKMDPRIRDAMRDDGADERLTLEMYYDFWVLVHQYEVDSVAAAKELERRCRGKK